MASKRIKKWRQGKMQLAALKKSQENHVAIEVVMRVKVDGPKRPICIDCGHSVMSHGERDGKLFCWGCDSVNQKQCGLTHDWIPMQRGHGLFTKRENDNTGTAGN